MKLRILLRNSVVDSMGFLDSPDVVDDRITALHQGPRRLTTAAVDAPQGAGIQAHGSLIGGISSLRGCYASNRFSGGGVTLTYRMEQ